MLGFVQRQNANDTKRGCGVISNYQKHFWITEVLG